MRRFIESPILVYRMLNFNFFARGVMANENPRLVEHFSISLNTSNLAHKLQLHQLFWKKLKKQLFSFFFQKSLSSCNFYAQFEAFREVLLKNVPRQKMFYKFRAFNYHHPRTKQMKVEHFKQQNRALDEPSQNLWLYYSFWKISVFCSVWASFLAILQLSCDFFCNLKLFS